MRRKGKKRGHTLLKVLRPGALGRPRGSGREGGGRGDWDGEHM